MRYFFLTLFIIFFNLTEAKSNDLFYLNGKININTAEPDDFKQLPFIGKKKADSIINFRKKNGLFKAPEDIISVPGIGKELYQALEQFITINGETTLRLELNRVGELVNVNSFTGNLFPLENNKYFEVLIKKISKAKKSINICMFLFKTGSSSRNMANQVQDALTLAAKRGVDVNVILEKNDWDDDSINQSNDITAAKLREAGISVVFDRKDITTHSKLIVIDEHTVFIGSHNLTDSALRKNNETTLMVESEEMAAYFLSYIKGIEAFR